MSVSVIGGLVGLLLIFGLIVCVIGNNCLVDAFKNEYSTVTYHMADSAEVFVNGDSIDDYLDGKKTDEYADTRRRLNLACDKLNVSLLYVIKVDESDYGRFVSVFNSINNSVDNTAYTAWELGFKRDTTNDEYREKYRALYAHKADYETVFRMNPTDGSHPHITTLVPVENRNGDVKAILCIQRPMSEMEGALRPYFFMILLGVLVMVVLISTLATFFLRKFVISPVEKVSAETTRFAKENVKGEPLGKLSRYDVILNLAHSIDSMETEIVRYIDNMTAVTAERERLSAELSVAATIQENSIPHDFPAFPDRTDFDVYASMTPAKMVGGDFYNFFMVDDDRLAVVIGDVSDKGIPASLFMMVTNILMRDRTAMGGTPAEILGYVNENLCEHNKAEMFVTIWLGIVELSTGKVIAANAGHEDAAVYRKNGEFELLKTSHDFVVGGMSGFKFRNFEFELKEGDKIFIYTDGVPEANDKDNKLYGMERMLSALNDNKEGSPEEILAGVRESINDFVGNAPQFDDLTMLCLEYKGKNMTEKS